MKQDLRHKVIGSRRRALSRWYMIKHRCENPTDKNKAYQDREFSLDKEEFIEWFMKRDFDGCSVDRVDNTKGYTLDNIQLLTVADNIRKDRTKAKNGLCECYRCKQTKPLEAFCIDSRRGNGHATICRKCDWLRKKEKSTGVV